MGLCLIPPFFFLSLSFSSSSLSLSLSLSLSSVAACCWVEPSCSLCFFVIPVALLCFCLPCSLCSIHSVIVCFSPLGLFCCCLDLFFLFAFYLFAPFSVCFQATKECGRPGSDAPPVFKKKACSLSLSSLLLLCSGLMVVATWASMVQYFFFSCTVLPFSFLIKNDSPK